METTNKKTERFIKKLSPVKKRIAQYLNMGLSKEEATKKVSKENNAPLSNTMAWATMVVNLATKKGIVFGSTENKTKPTYSHDETKDLGKIAIRNRVIEEVLASINKSGLVLTLSWIKCILETKLNGKLKGLQFLSCEQDRPTFNQLETFVQRNNLDFMYQLLRCEIGKIIRISARDTFAHLFLDYCGGLKTFEDEIAFAIKNKIVKKDGIVWITVSSRTGKKGFNTEKALKELVKKAGGEDYKIEFLHGYRDSSPMTSIIIRRIN